MKKVIWALCVSILVGLPGIGWATEFRAGNIIKIGQDEVISDDLLAFGKRVMIEGVVEGDVITAASTISIDGMVFGNVMAAGDYIELEGHVDNSARLAGRIVVVSGEIGRNLAIAGQDVVVDDAAMIGTDVNVAGNSIIAGGAVDRDVTLVGANVDISGQVEGDVFAEANRLLLSPAVKIGGDFSYRTPKEPIGLSEADIAGESFWLAPVEQQQEERFDWVWALLGGIIAFVTGAVMLGVARKYTLDAANAVSQPVWKSLVFGFLLLVATPVAALIICCTVVGLTLGLTLLMLYLIMLLLGGIPVAISVGRRLLQGLQRGRTSSPFLALFVGVVILGILIHLPYLGIVFRLLMLIFGLGALSRATKGVLTNSSLVGIPG